MGSIYNLNATILDPHIQPPSINILDFPRLTGETSDSPRIQRAFNTLPAKATNPTGYYKGFVVYFPPGEYDISQTIIGTNVGIIGSVGTVFKGTGSGYMFEIAFDGELSYPHVSSGNPVYQWRDFPIENCVFNGNGLMSGIKHSSGHNISVKDCTFLDTTDYGYKIESGSKYYLENLTFRGISNVLTVNKTAMHLGGSDHNVNNVMIINYTNGIVVDSTITVLDQIHMWSTSDDRIPNTVMFDINAGGNIISNSYIDTIKTGININTNQALTISNLTGLNGFVFGLTGAIYVKMNQNADLFISGANINDPRNASFISVSETDAGDNIKMIGIRGNCANIYDKY